MDGRTLTVPGCSMGSGADANTGAPAVSSGEVDLRGNGERVVHRRVLLEADGQRGVAGRKKVAQSDRPDGAVIRASEVFAGLDHHSAYRAFEPAGVYGLGGEE